MHLLFLSRLVELPGEGEEDVAWYAGCERFGAALAVDYARCVAVACKEVASL